MKNIIIAIVAVVALGGGYFIGSSGNTNESKLQDSVAMMKEQSVSIQKMAEMMKSSGLSVQEAGMKYNDEVLVAEGKDLQAVGEKYAKENAKATEDSNSMKKIME
ncbi:MAG: hypothetical protein Q7S36_00315 [Candidatus Liptonbacteria bacterium]|nr:hypothetical protein [Candidatus Liptonbacteria bacterium]